MGCSSIKSLVKLFQLLKVKHDNGTELYQCFLTRAVRNINMMLTDSKTLHIHRKHEIKGVYVFPSILLQLLLFTLFSLKYKYYVGPQFLV